MLSVFSSRGLAAISGFLMASPVTRVGRTARPPPSLKFVSLTVNTSPQSNIMKPNTLLITLLLLQAPLFAHAYILAGPITNAANGHVYYLLSQDTWSASQAEARTLGGDLVTINDAGENQWVFNTFSSFGGVNRNLWIGLTDTQQSGQFSWASGQSVTYQNWSPGEPNFIGQEHYASMYPNGLPDGRTAGAWFNYYDGSDLGSLGPLHGVVEVDSLKAHQEGTLFLGGNGDYATIPSASDLQNPTEITVEAWIYPRSTAGHGWFISKADGQTV